MECVSRTSLTRLIKLEVILTVLMALVGSGLSTCYIKRWNYARDSQDGGWNIHQCDRPSEIATFYAKDGMECCSLPNVWSNSSVHTLYAFQNCPDGYFVQGLTDTHDEAGYIDYYRCSRPHGHPYAYSRCYDESNVKRKCRDTYFYTGDVSGETMKCCQLVDDPDVINSKDKVKGKIMEDSLTDMAKLADLLGFAYTQGCIARGAGDSFVRSGYKWTADDRQGCSDQYFGSERLSLTYGHWKFVPKSISKGTAIVEDIEPEVIDAGTVENNDKTEASKEVEYTETVARTVSHTATRSWLDSTEVGIGLSMTSTVTASAGDPLFTNVEASLSVSVENTYSFKYEQSETKQDSTGKEHSETFKVSSSKQVAPYSSAKWSVLLTKGKLSIPYTATYIMRFSTGFSGAMKPGNALKTDSRATSYTWGDENTPFYHSLKNDRRIPSTIWRWSYILDDDAEQLINSLCDETRYEVNLTGVFTVVAGRKIDIHWEGEDINNDKSSGNVEDTNNGQSTGNVTRSGSGFVRASNTATAITRMSDGPFIILFSMILRVYTELISR